MVGRPRADADARAARRARSSRCSRTCRGRTGASTATFEHDGPRYTAPGSTRPSPRATTTTARDDRIFDEARAQRDRGRRAGRPGARERDAQAVARVGAAAVRPHQPPARGEPALRLVGAPHALGGAALLRARTRCSPTRAPTRAACPTTTAPPSTRCCAAFAGRARATRASPTTRARRARLLERGLENEARIFDDAGVSDHFAIIPTGALPRGRSRATTSACSTSWRAASSAPSTRPRCGSASSARPRSAGESFRTRARTLMEPGWRAVLRRRRASEEEEAPLRRRSSPGAERGERRRGARARGARVEAEETQAARAHHRGAPALADGERGPAASTTRTLARCCTRRASARPPRAPTSSRT